MLGILIVALHEINEAYIHYTSLCIPNAISSLVTYGETLLETETMYISVVAKIEQKGECLVWYQIVEPYADAKYIPVVFTLKDTDTLRYAYTGLSRQRVLDIVAFPWQEGYSFLICDPDCTTLRLTQSDKALDIPIEQYPFSYYIPYMPDTYSFLDVDGNLISQGIVQ